MSNPYKSPSTEGQRTSKPQVRFSLILLIVLALVIPLALAFLLFANAVEVQMDSPVPAPQAIPQAGSGKV